VTVQFIPVLFCHHYLGVGSSITFALSLWIPNVG